MTLTKFLTDFFLLCVFPPFWSCFLLVFGLGFFCWGVLGGFGLGGACFWVVFGLGGLVFWFLGCFLVFGLFLGCFWVVLVVGDDC